MRNILLILIIIPLINCRKTAEEVRIERYQELVRGFKEPPGTAKPWVYWYWISDNISREGVTRDLEAMSELGIGAALIGNIFLPDVPRGSVPVLSDEWFEITRHAIREGKRLNIDIGLFNCPGWAQSGGPWISTTDAMRYLTYSSIQVKGPGKFPGKLEAPQKTFQDVAVLAYPVLQDNPMETVPMRINSSIPLENSFDMIDGDLDKGCEFPIEMMKKSPLIVDIEFTRSIEARSLTIYPRNEPFSVSVELQVRNENQFIPVRKFTLDRSNNMPTVGPIPYGPEVISFEKVISDQFRLIFSNLNEREVWFTDVERKGGVNEIVLTESARLEKYVEKQLGKMYQLPLPQWIDYHWDEQPDYLNDTFNINPDSVRNLTEYLLEDGNLNWEIPDGEWMVLRVGMAPTGVTNAPVSEEGLGLEVDKMSEEKIRAHFNSFIGPLIEDMPSGTKSALKYLVVDSYETGSQNWTDGFADLFEARFGYDPVPWLPVLTGRIIHNADLSDRFLWDLRRLVADEMGEKYIGGLQNIAAENGLKLWLENYGHWGFPGEFLQYGGRADLVSGEFWAEGDLGNIECRAASSASHIYGKQPVFAEALTAAGEHFTRYPAMLRKRGDWSYTQGINHFVLHVYIQQPYQDRFPGVNAWFGVEFNRHNTWFKHAKPWIDYLMRCHFLLQQGAYKADVCYFIGEGAPLMTGILDPPLPPGYSFDFINSDVILNKLTVINGRLTLSNGISYRLLVLPPLQTMTPELLTKISELVNGGATILGSPPKRSPSMANYPDGDLDVQELANEMWLGCDGENVKSVAYGKGRVLRGLDLAEAFEILDVKADVEIPANHPIHWIHCFDPNYEIYFMTNQGDHTVESTFSFRVDQKQPELWDAVSGTIKVLPEFSIEESRMEVPLKFSPGQSFFIIFSDPVTDSVTGRKNFPDLETFYNVSGPWNVSFDSSLGGPPGQTRFEKLIDWTSHPDERIRHYSGLSTYQTSFDLDELPMGNDVYLSLGNVKHLAEIRMNGKDVGGVWTDPWHVKITGLVQEGENELEIDVVNTWVNRLVKDSGLPEEKRITWAAINPYRPDDPLESSGLLGPVTVVYSE